MKYTDDELINVEKSEDNAPVKIITRCKSCGQILDDNAKDCWKCTSKDIEKVVEEENVETEKTILQARMDKIEDDMKNIKRTNEVLYIMFFVMAVITIIMMISINKM